MPLLEKYKKKEFVHIGDYDLVETIDAHATLSGDEAYTLNVFDVIKTEESYVERELNWYLSESLNINPGMSDIKIWAQTADEDGLINSNYGWCIFSDENFNQYKSAVEFLKKDRQIGRAHV